MFCDWPPKKLAKKTNPDRICWQEKASKKFLQPMVFYKRKDMTIDFHKLPRTVVTVDAQLVTGRFEAWRHTIGHGAVNSMPLPGKVLEGTRKLKPRLMRVFLQEYFDIYPEHGVFNWTKLDAYMDSFAQTGTKLLATINFKPRVLFPEMNHDIWRPNNVEEYQNLIYQLVRRYSVEKPIVTHWEHANEGDIGWWGGCPFRFGSIEESFEFYQMLLKPIQEAFPQAKVGGPCPGDFKEVPGFIELCARHGTQLDFVTYHGYTSDLSTYQSMAEKLSAVLDKFPGNRPELMMDEWNQSFPPNFSDGLNLSEMSPTSPIPEAYDLLSVEEMAMQGRRAATAAKIMLTLQGTRLDWSFYFLLWDNCMFNDEFSAFFSAEWAQMVMYQHWNEKPHRFGLFSESGKVRPQYFVFQMFSRMGEEKLQSASPLPDLTAFSARENGRISVMLINYDPAESQDRIVKVHFSHLKTGRRRLKALRIDDGKRWSEEMLELLPVDERLVDVLPDFEYQFFSPADSVLLVTLDESH
jgi:xylan 1,4-beta-xylosidase